MLLSIPQTVFCGYLPPKQATELLILINTENNWRWPQKSKCQQITFQWHVFQTPKSTNPQTTTTRFDVFIVLSWYLESLLVEQEADEWERLVTPPAPGPTWLFYTSTQLLFYTAGLLLNLRHILTSLLQMFMQKCTCFILENLLLPSSFFRVQHRSL